MSTTATQAAPIPWKCRPKHEVGLWVEILMRDGTSIEAIMPNALLEFQKLLHETGLVFARVRGGSSSQPLRNVRIPRALIDRIEVLGVFGGKVK